MYARTRRRRHAERKQKRKNCIKRLRAYVWIWVSCDVVTNSCISTILCYDYFLSPNSTASSVQAKKKTKKHQPPPAAVAARPCMFYAKKMEKRKQLKNCTYKKIFSEFSTLLLIRKSFFMRFPCSFSCVVLLFLCLIVTIDKVVMWLYLQHSRTHCHDEGKKEV